MFLSEVVQIIQDRLGFRADLDAKIKTNIRLAQTELENGDIMPWFLLTHVILPSVPESNDRVLIPSGYLGIPEEESQSSWIIIGDDTEPCELHRDDWAHIIAMRQAGYTEIDLFDVSYQEGTGYVMLVGPGEPSESVLIAFAYYSSAKELTEDEDENAWLSFAPEYLIGGAGKKIAAALRDKDAITYFQGMQKEARIQLIAADTRHRTSGSRMVARYIPKGTRSYAVGTARRFR